MGCPEEQNPGFDAEDAINALMSLERMSGLDATLFSTTPRNGRGEDGIRIRYSSYGCLRSCPRSVNIPEGQMWNEECRKCHISAGMLADRHGGHYVYVCPERKLFIAGPIMVSQMLRAIMTIGPAEVSEDEDEDPIAYPGYAPFKQRNSQTFHDITRLLAATAAYESDNEDSYLRKVGKTDISARSDMSERLVSESKNTRARQYPMLCERALVKAISEGDNIGALASLDKLYGFFLSERHMLSEHATFDILTDLRIVIAHAGMAAGVDSHIISQINDRCKQELNYVSDSAQIYQRLRFLAEEVSGYVQSLRNIRYDRAIYMAKTYIYSHYKEHFSLDDIAEAVDYSPAYLSRVFKQKTGLKVTEFTNKVRVEAAMSELLATDYSASEIAKRTGFESLSYFTRIFKKMTDMTPGQYRTSRGGAPHMQNAQDADGAFAKKRSR